MPAFLHGKCHKTPPLPLPLQRDHQRGHIRGADAGDPAGLSQVQGPDGLEFLPGLQPQALDGAVVQIRGQFVVLHLLEVRHLLELALDVPLVFYPDFHLLRHLTLLDNVLLPGLLARNEPRAALRSRAGELLERLDVGELADHGVGEASGGQLQRVAIARALINRPRLLVADEPTGALDSAASDDVMGALAALHAEGMTIVLVTHDPGVAARADRGVRMVDGRLSARAAATTLPAAQEPPRRCS